MLRWGNSYTSLLCGFSINSQIYGALKCVTMSILPFHLIRRWLFSIYALLMIVKLISIVFYFTQHIQSIIFTF